MRHAWSRLPLLLLILFAPSIGPGRAEAQSTGAVKAVEFEARSVGRKLKYNVILPSRYDASQDRYPVLYLLHGYSGNYLNWAGMQAPQAAAPLDLIVVMPDGGNSWYANWSDVEGGGKEAWESYMIDDLIPHVDATYRTVAARDGRAINGLSMGGYGAIMLGLRHPDLFCSIGSHSGALAFARSAAGRMRAPDGPDAAQAKARAARKLSDRPNEAIGVEGFQSQVERTPKGKLFPTAEAADAYDPFKLVVELPKEKLPHIMIDCGLEDNLITSSQDFARVLMERKIPFTYAESPGRHDGAYWSREIHHSMTVQYRILRRNLDRAQQEKAKAEKDKEAETK